MSLPPIIAPSQAPVFLADGHSIVEDSVYAAVRSATGHVRLRRARTQGERTVSVRWFLEADALEAVDDWYENVLQAGALPFSARVANQDGSGLVWWRARWVEFSIDLLHKGRGILTGRLFLVGEPSETGPELGTLNAEVSVALAGSATVTIPNALAAEIVVALIANSADTLMAAEIAVALDGTAEVFEILLAAEVSVPLDGEATATIGTGACSPFTVLGDTSITITSGGPISPLGDTGETFDSCRVLS